LKKKNLFTLLIIFILLSFILLLKKKVFKYLIRKQKTQSKNHHPHLQTKNEIKFNLTSKIMIPGQCYCMNEKYNIFKNNNYKFKISKNFRIKIYKKQQEYLINKICCCKVKNIIEDNNFSNVTMCISNQISEMSKTCYYYRFNKDLKNIKKIEVYKNIYRYIIGYYSDKFFCAKYLTDFNSGYYKFKLFIKNCFPDFICTFNNILPDIYEYILGKQLELIISLTSYPPRINTINLTIKSLLNQSLKADKVILWLAPEQFPNKEKDLPKNLTILCNYGLTIDWYHDIKSYKKLIPTLIKYPNAIIATVDDDAIYPYQWLEKLYTSYQKYPKNIHAHRVTQIYYNGTFQTIAGGYHYYKNGNYLNKLVGLGGVLYPPYCFYKDILNETLFMKLAPTNDDQWFWFQGVLNGFKVRVVENPFIKANYVPGSQNVALCKINDKGPNLFWVDFNRLLRYYTQLKGILLREYNKTKGEIEEYLQKIISKK